MSILKIENGVIYAEAYRHVLLQTLSPYMATIQTAAKNCARRILDEQGLAAKNGIDTSTEHVTAICRQHAEAALRDDAALMDLGKQWARHGGLGDSDAEVIGDFETSVRYFCRVADRHVVEFTDGEQMWCID